ncbi:hypothetical protein AK812_SmicGene12659 [Symbiodinium microadriaticum]|uniref:Uncharacterized protein n=1 Tax=Symbiodinium microadriaticum TaxID=2951 RepID=A0A1Q9EA12_SYMMI|nr:hypothetical protein AK812_SmicGene12659 [Symbiodinium microadriaticum]
MAVESCYKDRNSLQWPSAVAWAGRLQTLCKALQKKQTMIMDTKMKAAAKKALLEVNQKKAAASKKKGEEEMKSLSKKALEDLLKDPAGKPCFENLSLQTQAEVLKIIFHTGWAIACGMEVRYLRNERKTAWCFNMRGKERGWDGAKLVSDWRRTRKRPNKTALTPVLETEFAAISASSRQLSSDAFCGTSELDALFLKQRREALQGRPKMVKGAKSATNVYSYAYSFW